MKSLIEPFDIVDRFGVSEDQARMVCPAVRPSRDGWSQGTWFMWVKNRLAEIGALRCGHSCPDDVRLAVPLHIFFVHLDETPEMVAKLPEADVKAKASQVARSKIMKTNLPINPIDRVALRVAKEPA